jgi:hypothetical protein
MNKQILFGGIVAALTLVPIVTSLMARAAGSNSPGPTAPVAATVDLSKFDCRTLLHMDGEDRDNAVLFLHGYVSAEKKQTIIELAPIAASTDKILDYCIDHPTAIALTVFTNNR